MSATIVGPPTARPVTSAASACASWRGRRDRRRVLARRAPDGAARAGRSAAPPRARGRVLLRARGPDRRGLGGEIVYAEAGDLVFKPRGQWHTFWNAATSRAASSRSSPPAASSATSKSSPTSGAPDAAGGRASRRALRARVRLREHPGALRAPRAALSACLRTTKGRALASPPLRERRTARPSSSGSGRSCTGRRPARRCRRPARREPREPRAERAEVQARDLLVEVLGQHVDALLVLVVLREHSICAIVWFENELDITKLGGRSRCPG